MRFSLIPFVLLAIPIAEIATFIVIGGQIGVLWTFALILFTAILGSILLRVQGFQIVSRLREETNAGRIPGKELGHGAMIMVAGILLITPGFITDTLGFLLFVPFIRTLIWTFLASRIHFADLGSMRDGFARGPFSSKEREGVVDLDPDEFEDLDRNNFDKKPSKRDPSSPWRDFGMDADSDGKSKS